MRMLPTWTSFQFHPQAREANLPNRIPALPVNPGLVVTYRVGGPFTAFDTWARTFEVQCKTHLWDCCNRVGRFSSKTDKLETLEFGDPGGCKLLGIDRG